MFYSVWLSDMYLVNVDALLLVALAYASQRCISHLSAFIIISIY